MNVSILLTSIWGKRQISCSAVGKLWTAVQW